MLTRAADRVTFTRYVVCLGIGNNPKPPAFDDVPKPPAFDDVPKLFHSVRFTIACSVSVLETLNDMHGNVSPPMLIGSRSFVPDSVNQIV